MFLTTRQVRPRQTGHIPPPHHSPPFANAAVVASRSILPCSPNCSTNAVGAPLPCGTRMLAWTLKRPARSGQETCRCESDSLNKATPYRRQPGRGKQTRCMKGHPRSSFLGGSSGCLVAAWAETAGLKSATVPAGSPATARGAPVKREKRREKPERTTILIDHPERPVPETGGVM